MQGVPNVGIHMRHERNILIHLLFSDSSHKPCSLQRPKKRNTSVSGQVSVVAIQCFLFSRTIVNNSISTFGPDPVFGRPCIS